MQLYYHTSLPSFSSCTQEPAPWVPAVPNHTTKGASDEAETHFIRAVNTGIFSVSKDAKVDPFSLLTELS